MRPSLFVCTQCGDKFERRDVLEDHWRIEQHGPEDVAGAQIEKARKTFGPTETAMVQRRRFHPSSKRRL